MRKPISDSQRHRLCRPGILRHPARWLLGESVCGHLATLAEAWRNSANVLEPDLGASRKRTLYAIKGVILNRQEFQTIFIPSYRPGGIMKQRISVFWSTCLVAFFAAWVPPGHAQPAVAGPAYSPPFTETLSNHVPLAFGMDPMTAANALGETLNYMGGSPGNEVFLAFLNYGGSNLFNRKDRLYLQFRRGRLVGWKGDWGRNWMWR